MTEGDENNGDESLLGKVAALETEVYLLKEHNETLQHMGHINEMLYRLQFHGNDVMLRVRQTLATYLKELNDRQAESQKEEEKFFEQYPDGNVHRVMLMFIRERDGVSWEDAYHKLQAYYNHKGFDWAVKATDLGDVGFDLSFPMD